MYIRGEDVIKSSTKATAVGYLSLGPLIYHLLSWTDKVLSSSSSSLPFKSYLIFLCLFEGEFLEFVLDSSQVWTMKRKAIP